ncbi:AMP-binding protein [Rhodococcus qingshengii]|uniref:AMP-binding protein n=1 Tax=Rhodococcus qingshengii TaxID=334542 RepID=UPI00237CAC9E|nr:AMP-binding protein [Rhodococcus qingshengii]WCT06031.1 AMP-binding protein [Rhodococcus qingshengii]
MSPRENSPHLYSSLITEALARYRSRDAFICGTRHVSYATTAAKVANYRDQLTALGFGSGSGMAALSPNIPELWMVQAAAITLGGRFTGLHLLGSLEDHVFVCSDSEASVLVVAEEFAAHGQAIADRVPTITQVIILSEDDTVHPAPSVPSGSQTAADSRSSSAAELDEGTIALLQYTGGTTGRPKGVLLSQRAMSHQVLSLTAGWGLPETPRYLAASPITHVALLPIVPTLLRGGTVVLLRSFDPTAWFEAVATHRVNYAFTVPTMLYALLDDPRSRDHDTSSLQTIVYGASPMSPARLDEGRRRFGEIFVQIYGQSENGAIATVLRADDHQPEHLASCGRAVVGTEIAILDENGTPLDEEIVGELCVRSPAVMVGYHNRPEETAEALRGGWLHTGDVARRDARGFFYIVDRKKDMIISGGYNVYPREIEDALSTHPAVASAAVIGVPDDKWGEAVQAIVVLRAGHTPDAEEIRDHVRRLKGAVNTPKAIEFVGSLPLTPVGKIDKKILREPHWGNLARQVH